MKITRDKMFFSKDLIHTLAYVGMFVAAIISVGACKSGIWVADYGVKLEFEIGGKQVRIVES